MNSRSAKNDIAANSTKVVFLPSRKATAKTPIMTHQARMRLLRFCTTSRPASVLTLMRSTAPISEANSMSPTTPAISQ